MSWLDLPTGYADPAHYVDAADPVERELRADAAQRHYLLELAPFGENAEETDRFNAKAAELAGKWGRHPSIAVRALWRGLQNAITEFTVDPERAGRRLQEIQREGADGQQNSTTIWSRTLRQAAELTGRWDPTINSFDRERADTGVERSTASPEQNLAAQFAATPLAEQRRQIAAVQMVQNAYADHTRTAESFSLEPYGAERVDELEDKLSRARWAYYAAKDAGVPPEVLASVYRAGVAGTYWHDGPGDFRLNPASGRGLPVLAASAGDLGADAAGAAPNSSSPDPPASAPDASTGGTEIGAAVQAAVADAEHADWQAVEHRDPNLTSPTAEPTRDLGL
ncbi:hypothetical protein ACIBCD_33875 [Nocardia brasiliensis]|uniref:hypothetical protein n=1 Tax=Nocardia brasiliensis TaxID=37326 RepID=UPI0037961D82